MVEFMQPLKNTCLKETQWCKKMLTKYPVVGKRAGTENSVCHGPVLEKYTYMSGVCGNI